MVVPLPTDEADPVSHIRACRDALLHANEEQEAQPRNLMQQANDLVPPVLFGPADLLVSLLKPAKAKRR
jgi:diacylglycerol O-acyltransferase